MLMGSDFNPVEEVGDEPWYILRAATRQEARACESLKELKVEHYMPTETLKRKLNRREVVYGRALFPGYLFARIPDALFHVAINADGVHNAVHKTNTSGERVPCRVQAGLVAELKAAEKAGEFDRTKTLPIEVGDAVRITDGPFEGRAGEILKLKSGDRIQLMLDGYGKTTVSAEIVERVA